MAPNDLSWESQVDSSVKRLFAPTRHPDAFDELCCILGPRWVSVRSVDRVAYSHDVWPVAAKWIQQARFPYVPDIIVWPGVAQEVVSVLDVARRYGLPIVPFGGGSGTVGGILPLRSGVTVHLRRMDQIIDLDRTSLLVTAGAGMIGQTLEDQLNLEGCTLGHFPQSMRSASLGGYVAHKAVGTFSTKYGKFDDMVLGMQVVLPSVEILNITPVPKSSTGPNLNELFLGSEGTLGVVTEVTLKIHAMPELRLFRGYVVPSMRVGLDIIRRILQHDLKPAVVRLYDEVEAASKFELLGLRGGPCLLVLGFEGYRQLVELEERLSTEICRSQRAEELGSEPGDLWLANRFDTSSLIAGVCQPNGVYDCLEVAATWDRLADLYYEIRNAMEPYAYRVMGHTSHVYPQGGNLYMIFFAETDSPHLEEIEQLYYRILDATFQVCGRFGAAISHHHGIGLSKARWMTLQHGQAGMNVLRVVKEALDPDNLMNPGKLGLAG